MSPPPPRERDRVFRFACVGTLGFLIDAGLVFAIVESGLTGALPARVISFAAAVIATFALNRAWTFGPESRAAGQFARYLAAQSLGVAINYLVFTGVVLALTPAGRTADGAIAVLGVAAGSATAMAVNYALARLWVFARRP